MLPLMPYQTLFFYSRKEVNVIFRSTIVLAFYFSSFTTTLPVIMFVTFSTYSTIHGIDAVTPRQVFISLTLFAVVVNICNYIFVSNIIHLSEAFVAIKRIRVSFFVSQFCCIHLLFCNYLEVPTGSNITEGKHKK